MTIAAAHPSDVAESEPELAAAPAPAATATPAPATASAPRSALRAPGFMRYLSGQSISLLGNQIWSISLSWSAVHLASAGLAGLLLTVSSVPRLALMLLGGVIADRFDVRRLMIGSDLLRTLIALGAAAAALARPGIVLLALLSLVFGIVDAVFMPAEGSLQPRLLEPSQYAGGAMLSNLASRTALSIGAPLGGVLVAAGGVPLALAVDALTFAISVVTLASVRPRPLEPKPSAAPTGSAARAAGARSRPSCGGELREGIRFLIRHPVLGPMTLAFLFINVGFVGPMNIGIAELADHRGWGAAGIGLLLTGFGAGAALGGLLTPRLRIRRNAGWWIAVLGAVQGVGLLAVALVPSLAVAAVLTGWAGLLSGPMAVLSSVIQQSETPDAYRGRASSISTLISLGIVPVASAATGFIIAAFGLTADFVLGGLIECAALLTLLSPAFRRTRIG